MQVEQLYRGIIGINDKYIDEAQNAQLHKKYSAWKWWSPIAACMCLMAIFAVVLLKQQEQRPPQTETAKNYIVSISQNNNQGKDIYNLSYSEITAGMSIPVILSDGTIIQAAHITFETDDTLKDNTMTQEEAEYYAYMNYDTASTELKETIMAARNQIIYSQSWVADGFECYIIAPDGTQKKVAAFSELFPDWEMPIVDTEDAAVTPDGLGTNEQYGVFVKVMGIENDYMICQATSAFAPFEEGQSIRVYFPVNYDASCIEKGKNMMVSFYGRDCNRADGTIYANEISEQP